jgi:hypothetical protein
MVAALVVFLAPWQTEVVAVAQTSTLLPQEQRKFQRMETTEDVLLLVQRVAVAVDTQQWVCQELLEMLVVLVELD